MPEAACRSSRRSSRRPAESPPGGATEVDDRQDDPGDPVEVARIICLRLLDRRPYTRAELAAALRRREVPDEAAETVLDRYAEVGLIDDAALADAAAHALHAERGLARRAVQLKLQRRGIDSETVSQAVEGIDGETERATAAALVRRRARSLAGLPPEVQVRRLVGLLARKGYGPGVAWDVVRRELADAAELEGALDGPAAEDGP